MGGFSYENLWGFGEKSGFGFIYINAFGFSIWGLAWGFYGC
jgi:hypothetical protein